MDTTNAVRSFIVRLCARPMLERTMSYAYAYKQSIEYSVSADTTSGRYYWTNTYYWGSDYANPNSDPSRNAVTAASLAACSEGVTRERWRIESAFGTGSYYGEVIGPVACQIPGADRVLLIDSVRVYSNPQKGALWYKRLRGLLSASDVAGGRVSAEIIDWLYTYYVPMLASVPLVNCHFVPTGTISVDPVVRGWQLRDGTKRRARRVLRP